MRKFAVRNSKECRERARFGPGSVASAAAHQGEELMAQSKTSAKNTIYAALLKLKANLAFFFFLSRSLAVSK